MATNGNRLLVFTALALEYNAVKRLSTSWREVRHPQGNIYESTSIDGWEIALVETGPGNLASAQEAERAISYWKPDIAVFVGIAGGVKDVAIGDVVIASKVYNYEFGVDKETFLVRPDVYSPAYSLVQSARALVRKGTETFGDAFKVFVGPIAAGEKVVKSKLGQVAKLVRQSFGDTLAIEMEGAGFLRAAYANKVDAVVIRGISDLLSGKSRADREGSQERASEAAAKVLKHLLHSIPADLPLRNVEVSAVESSGGKAAALNSIQESALDVFSQLYPSGPRENEIWSEAGGDVSRLDLSETGRTQWSRALRRIERGGDVTLEKLIQAMLKDFPNNDSLNGFLSVLRRS